MQSMTFKREKMNTTNSLQILLLDDDNMKRDGFAAKLEKIMPNSNTYQAANYEQAIDILRENVNINFAFLDIELNSSALDRLSTVDLLRYIRKEEGKKTGVDLLKYIREEGLEISVIMLSDYDDVDLIDECLKEGASGYIPKSKYSNSVLNEVIELTFNGGTFLPFCVNENGTLETFCVNGNGTLESFTQKYSDLDEHQKKLFYYICLGYRLNDSKIEKLMGKSWKTLKGHASKIYRIFNVTGKVELKKKIAKLGFIPTPPNPEN